jgi:hypothetical protein
MHALMFLQMILLLEWLITNVAAEWLPNMHALMMLQTNFLTE